MTMYESLGREIGALVGRKNAAYGDAFGKVAQILEILYPDGIGRESYHDVGLLVRVLDKLSRIATDAGAFGESPYLDIAGYMLLAEARWRQAEEIENESWRGGMG